VYFEEEKKIADALRGWIGSGVIKSAHDCSEGGLAVALSESCFSEDVARNTPRLLGAKVSLESIENVNVQAALFGESQARIVVTVEKAFLPKVLGQAAILEVPVTEIGTVGGDRLSIDYGDDSFSWSLSDLHKEWWSSIESRLS
jgi:phosphoribosylformylglycinamidine synthase